MGIKIRRNKRFCMLLILGIVLCGVCMGKAGMTVKAKEQTFVIDAKMLPSDQSAYEIQLQVENQGQDWEGTVRLKITEDYYGGLNDCAYDTELSLPQGSAKQFVVKVPKDSIDRTDGAVQVTLLSQKEGKVAQKEFRRLLQEEVEALTMGILSDEYMSLTYLDMGGNEFYYYGKNYPIRLEQLDQDKLADSLDALDFLVIDSYNTGVLSDKTLENIRQWRDNGGMLIIGTGENAEDVLTGFDELGIQCSRIYDPGEGTYGFSDYVDVSQLHMAELIDVNGNYKQGYDIFVLLCSQGNGAVGILPYSLSEVEKLNAAGNYEQQKSFVESMVEQVSGYASSGYGSGQYTSYYDGKYYLTSISSYLGNGSNRLQFGWLKLIVILYVIFVGPVLYLILRFAKKRDYYWIAVPVTTLVGIFLVYWAGRGFEVVSTNVYSVTVENLFDKGNARTYLHCYDAGHKEWALRLAEGYEYVGPLEDSSYKSSDEDYYYHIRKEGGRLFFGINPSIGFEDGYFQAGMIKEPKKGGIYSDLKYSGQQSIRGTVTNDTGQNFKYFAVSKGEDLFVYKDLPAGAEIKLETTEVVYNNDSGYYNGLAGYYYSFLREARSGEMAKDIDILTALGIGVSSTYSAEDPDKTVIIGVIEDWDKVVDDKCSEVSYGCLYAVQ
ncbi:MAG: hypothetical protein K2L82_16190 [Lachnospiraceae bacterium]|nr:hypothetical protein [Lachnospiraceae bacterium]